MKTRARPAGPQTGPETGRLPRLEGRFKDHRDIARPRGDIGDLRVTPRPEPQKPPRRPR